ncbi:unspecified product [Plasmodium ovale curtisi]|uniref:Unspecified product n=1 Tax=Plasmodium ovale curtisi TaxID=864141 RepID=A0A1A8WLQ8_PLAOA|nr:unspecified product [Plasmodium ovale curtisi]
MTDLSTNINVKEYIESCNNQTYTDFIESSFQKIVSSYQHYGNFLKNNSKEKCFLFIKYWIDERRNHYQLIYSGHSSLWNQHFPSLWRTLVEKYSRSNQNCNFKNEEKYSLAINKINRFIDELHSVMNVMSNEGNIRTHRDICLLYVKEKNSYMNKILIQLSSVSNFYTLKHDYLKIIEECSMKHFYTFSPVVTCLTQVRTEEVEFPQNNAFEKTLLVEHPTEPNICRTEVAHPMEDLSYMIKLHKNFWNNTIESDCINRQNIMHYMEYVSSQALQSICKTE